MAIGCCNLIIFSVCEAKQALRRSEWSSRSCCRWLGPRAAHTRGPERGRGAPTRAERRLPAADFTPVHARARRERLVCTRYLSTNFSVSKIADGSTFEWSFPISTGLLWSVRSLQRTQVYSSTWLSEGTVLFFVLDRVRDSRWVGAVDVCEWLFRLPTWKVALDEAVHQSQPPVLVMSHNSR